VRCSNCGVEVGAGSRFCQNCGSPQIAPLPPPPVTTERKTRASTLLVVALVAGLVAIIFAAGNITKPPAVSPAQEASDPANNLETIAGATANEANTVTAGAAPASPWSYSTSEDKVRGANTYFASTTSTNSIEQGFPYGSSTLSMTVRKSPAHGTDVYLTLASGQLMCPSYEGCYGTVRFDKGSPQRMSFSGSSDNSSDVIFVDGAKSFITKLRRAKRAVVEVEVYQSGRPQFEFDVQGLEWKH
jgi:hypothetical protein